MKAVILCAGLGSRTGLNYPKCLYKFSDGKTLLKKNLETLVRAGFKKSDIILVTGFKSSLIKKETKNLYKYIHNSKFRNTNMVYSFYEVIKKYKSQDYFIFYADIIFTAQIVKKLIRSKKKILTLIDSDWLKKWRLKKNYLNDLEELKIKKKKIISLGKKVNNIKNINGRFIGITKFSKSINKDLKKNKIIKELLILDNKIDFTNFLMHIIKKNYSIYALRKKINWFEFDNLQDFKIYEKIDNYDLF